MEYGGHGIAEAAVARILLPGCLCLVEMVMSIELALTVRSHNPRAQPTHTQSEVLLFLVDTSARSFRASE